MCKSIIVDRILHGFAVCEKDGVIMDISLSDITGKVKEGDMLRVHDNSGRYSVDTGETEKRRASISERFELLKKRER